MGRVVRRVVGRKRCADDRGQLLVAARIFGWQLSPIITIALAPVHRSKRTHSENLNVHVAPPPTATMSDETKSSEKAVALAVGSGPIDAPTDLVLPELNGKVALMTGITGQDGSYLTELLLSKVCVVPSRSAVCMGCCVWRAGWALHARGACS